MTIAIYAQFVESLELDDKIGVVEFGLSSSQNNSDSNGNNIIITIPSFWNYAGVQTILTLLHIKTNVNIRN
jgi:hypothetical protein